MKKLFSIIMLIFIGLGCEGKVGPVGPQGIQGEKGEPGKSIVDEWTYSVKADDVKKYEGNWWVLIYDDRFNTNATYEVWQDLYGDGKVWFNQNLFYNILGYQFAIMISEGLMLMSADTDMTGAKLKIFKIR